MTTLSPYKTINGHLFQHHDSYFAFDIEELLSIKITKRYYDILSALMAGNAEELHLSAEEADDLNQLIANNFIFKAYDESELVLVDKKQEARVSFPPTHRCNFRCKYCFAEAGANYQDTEKEFSEETLEEMVEFLYADYFREYQLIRFDFVSGGEPLLNFAIIKKLKTLLEQADATYNKSSYIWMCTNGYLLTDEILEYMEANKISLGISYEGGKAYHDQLRVLETGEGTYDVVSKKITGLLSNPNLTGFLKNFWSLGVVTSKAPGITGMIEHHLAAGIKNLQLKLVRLGKENEYALKQSDVEKINTMYTEFVAYLKHEISENRLEPLFLILNKNDVFGKFLIRLILQKKHIRRCGAGVNKISVCANGDIYPCDSFLGHEQFKMGNIRTGVASSTLNEMITIYRSSQCRECWIRYLCGGDCYHNAYISSRNISEPDQVICEINRHLVKLCIDLYDFITEVEATVQRNILAYATIKYNHF